VSDQPTDPITKLAGAAAALHELYTELTRAGFSDAQAMELVKAVLLKKS
jgi:alkylhydroperoxidase family enzyme